MNALEKFVLPDTQALPDVRQLPIQKVGEGFALSDPAPSSCAVYGLLKRPDEKWVTERAYDNPKFVEDLVRDIALRLQRDPRIGRFTVSSENFESIHNHSAYAEIEGRGAALID